jgi:ferredoxin-NAD(P)+ reductase (naphthalene dioxygenase ferredoxin-specific)
VELVVRPCHTVVQFTAGETLLETLRRAQVPISYSCQDGRCGLCRCIVIPGRHSNLSDRVDSSPVLACQTRLIEDGTVELLDIADIVVHPARIVAARVIAVEPSARDVRMVRLDPQGIFEFSPGQYVEVRWTRDLERVYSIDHSPGDPEIRLHVRIYPGGRASQFVDTQLQAGDKVRLRGPLGSCYLRHRHNGPVVMVSSGTGLAPMLSLLRDWAAARMTNPLRVYAGFTAAEEVYGLRDLQDLRNQVPSMRLSVLVAQGPLPKGAQRGLVTDGISADLGNLDDWQAYLFGSPVAVEASVRLLKSKGIEEKRMHADPFHFVGS